MAKKIETAISVLGSAFRDVGILKKGERLHGDLLKHVEAHGYTKDLKSAQALADDVRAKRAAGRIGGTHNSSLENEEAFYSWNGLGGKIYNGPDLGGIKQFPQKDIQIYAGVNKNAGGQNSFTPYNPQTAQLKARLQQTEGSHLQESRGYRAASKAWDYADAADAEGHTASTWLPDNGNTYGKTRQRDLQARATFADEDKLAEMDQLREENARRRLERAEDAKRRHAETPSSDKSVRINRENELASAFKSDDDIIHRNDYENYGDRLVKKTPEPTATPPFSVMDSPNAKDKIPGFSKVGAGKDTPPAPATGTGNKKAAEEVKTQAESTDPTPSSENKPPESDFNGGAGDDMDSFFKGKLEAKGISNADKYHVNRIQDEYKNYRAQIKNAGEDADKIAEVNKSFGIKEGANASEHFKGRANENASTMDWVMGNNVPGYAAGTALLGGAVASCFSNKGKMSNSELYGQNF